MLPLGLLPYGMLPHGTTAVPLAGMWYNSTMTVRRVVTGALLGGVAGLVIGYFLFAQVGESRVSVEALLTFDSGSGVGGAVRRVAGQVAGLADIRRSILLAGVAGAGAGAVGAMTPAGRRRTTGRRITRSRISRQTASRRNRRS